MEGTMKKREPITALELYSLDACEEEIKVFEREWPEGCAITKKNAIRADCLNLDAEFLTRTMSDEQHERFWYLMGESLYLPSAICAWMVLTGR